MLFLSLSIPQHVIKVNTQKPVQVLTDNPLDDRLNIAEVFVKPNRTSPLKLAVT